MTDFGGMGGRPGGVSLDEYEGDLFASALNRACGERMRTEPHNDRGGAWYDDTGAGAQVWAALSNVDWTHANGDTAAYSFRAAGDLVAAIVGHGEDYMDYYCSSPYAVVADWIAEAMAREGWVPR